MRPKGTRDPATTRADAFARLFDRIHAGAFIGTLAPDDSRAGDTTLIANPHLKQIFGYPRTTPDSEVAPFAQERFIDPDARVALLARLIADGAVVDYLVRVRRVNGSPGWIEVTAQAGPAGRDGTLSVEALVRDVSERKKSDDQSRDVYQQILQSEKMAALGQTVSGVAHELNNPLATIISWAERLSERSLDDTARRGISVIMGEAERAARIVRNLLTVARKRQTTRGMIDLNAVVTETLALREHERPNAITVAAELTPGLPSLFADRHQIQQVLLNLATNAEQAMLATHGRGTLTVRTSADANREAVVLEVADDGPGIAPDVRTRIFDPFFTTKPTGKGTGLGLTVAYAIVQEHGGRIRVESRASGGATFVVEIPVSVAEVATPVARPAMPPMDAVRGASVLLVEDERALAEAVAEALTDAGLRVDMAADGQAALSLMRNAEYDLVVCDLKMPRVDGMTLYRTLSESTRGRAPKVIFMTGDVAGTEAERFLDATGCPWLAKPFRLADLLRTVREVLT